MKATVSSKRFFKAQRERKRMHSLNKALDVLRKKLQLSLSTELRLSKFEALKLAKNYIHALEYITQGNDLTNDEFIKMLCLNMRQSTITVLQRLYFDEF